MKPAELQKEIRLRAARIIATAGSSHIGGVFSSADILAILYGEILARTDAGFIDSFILSKGHCCAGVYSALNALGYLSNELLGTYAQDGSPLMAHISHHVPHVEFSTGSLGHGLPFGIGKALASRANGNGKHIYVLLSDGELDEGSNWEAIHFAGHHKIDNITAIIDYNKLQSLTTTYETLDLEPLCDKFKAFRWKCLRCDGHNIEDLRASFAAPHNKYPKVILCDTIKGHPIDFMLNQVVWHYRPPSAEQLDLITQQLNRVYQ
jgi:transketolase